MKRKSGSRVLMYRSCIDGVEATSADTTQTFARHSHDRFGMGLVVLGGQRSASGRGPVEARAGDAITVNPGEVHDGSPLDERGRVWRMLYIAPELMHDVARDLDVCEGSSFEIERPVLRDARFAALFERAFCRALAGAVAVEQLAGEEAVFALLADVIGRHTTVCLPTRSAAVRAHSATRAVMRARMRIDDDPASTVTLAALAAEAGLSRFQLLREFARETGLPPHAYLIQRRVARARQLIATGCVLADAAAGAGFADQSHMTRAFVRLYGVTPANFAAAVR
jgi:AraC-like DNA-binding protein